MDGWMDREVGLGREGTWETGRLSLWVAVII